MKARTKGIIVASIVIAVLFLFADPVQFFSGESDYTPDLNEVEGNENGLNGGDQEVEVVDAFYADYQRDYLDSIVTRQDYLETLASKLSTYGGKPITGSSQTAEDSLLNRINILLSDYEGSFRYVKSLSYVKFKDELEELQLQEMKNLERLSGIKESFPDSLLLND